MLPGGKAQPQVDFDFAPYVGTYVDAGWSTNRASLHDLTLRGDGSFTGGGEVTSYGDGERPSSGDVPFRVLSGSDSKGGSGSYTFILYEGTQMIEDEEIPQERYYILYPAGVSDRVGGDSSKPRIFYADLTGGAWEGLYIKAD